MPKLKYQITGRPEIEELLNGFNMNSLFPRDDPFTEELYVWYGEMSNEQWIDNLKNFLSQARNSDPQNALYHHFSDMLDGLNQLKIGADPATADTPEKREAWTKGLEALDKLDELQSDLQNYNMQNNFELLGNPIMQSIYGMMRGFRRIKNTLEHTAVNEIADQFTGPDAIRIMAEAGGFRAALSDLKEAAEGKGISLATLDQDIRHFDNELKKCSEELSSSARKYGMQNYRRVYLEKKRLDSRKGLADQCTAIVDEIDIVSTWKRYENKLNKAVKANTFRDDITNIDDILQYLANDIEAHEAELAEKKQIPAAREVTEIYAELNTQPADKIYAQLKEASKRAENKLNQILAESELNRMLPEGRTAAGLYRENGPEKFRGSLLKLKNSYDIAVKNNDNELKSAEKELFNDWALEKNAASNPARLSIFQQRLDAENNRIAESAKTPEEYEAAVKKEISKSAGEAKAQGLYFNANAQKYNHLKSCIDSLQDVQTKYNRLKTYGQGKSMEALTKYGKLYGDISASCGPERLNIFPEQLRGMLNRIDYAKETDHNNTPEFREMSQRLRDLFSEDGSFQPDRLEAARHAASEYLRKKAGWYHMRENAMRQYRIAFAKELVELTSDAITAQTCAVNENESRTNMMNALKKLDGITTEADLQNVISHAVHKPEKGEQSYQARANEKLAELNSSVSKAHTEIEKLQDPAPKEPQLVK